MPRNRWASRTCITCRNRKVKCDQVEPPCGPCRLANRVCDSPYYDSGLVNVPKAPACQPSVSSLRLSLAQRSHPGVRNEALWQITPSLGPLYQLPVLATFVSEYMPEESRLPTALPQTFSWFATLPSQHGTHRLIDMGGIALSLTFLGAKYNDCRYIDSSRVHYGKVVHETNKRIWQKKSQKKCWHKQDYDELIGATILLSIYELYNSDRALESWMYHIRGAATLLQHRGPDKPIDQGLFCMLRTCVFYDCCGSRKATFLTQPEWLELAPKRVPFEQVLGIVLSIPSVQELRDLIPRESHGLSSDDINQKKGRFLKQINTTYVELQRWYLCYLGSRFNCPFRRRPANPGEIPILEEYRELGKLFPDVMDFPNHYDFQIMLLCWSGFFLLCSEATAVMETLQWPFDIPDSHRTPPPLRAEATWFNDECRRTEWPYSLSQSGVETIHKVGSRSWFFAERVCQCMVFSDSYPYGSAMKLSALSPLWLVKEYFRNRSPECMKWCEAFLCRFQVKDKGYGKMLANLDAHSYQAIGSNGNA